MMTYHSILPCLFYNLVNVYDSLIMFVIHNMNDVFALLT